MAKTPPDNTTPKRSKGSDTVTDTSALRSRYLDTEPAETRWLKIMEFREAFYDLLFGVNEGDASELNPLEKDVIRKITALVRRQEIPNSAMPKIDATVVRVIELSNNMDSCHHELINLIKCDPVMTGELLKLASSASVARHNRKETSPQDALDEAVIYLGREEIATLAATFLMKPMLTMKSGYFRLFGELAWRHSIQVAAACKCLFADYELETFSGYLLGLTHDTGKLIIYKMLIQAFRSADPEFTPGSSVFKKMLSEYSGALSFYAGKQWRLPRPLLIAMRDQVKRAELSEMSLEGRALFQANLLSELLLLEQAGLCSTDDILARMSKEGVKGARCEAIVKEVVKRDEQFMRTL